MTKKNRKRTCPLCKNTYYSYPAISRKDNKTEICPDCGIKEALLTFMNKKNNIVKGEIIWTKKNSL